MREALVFVYLRLVIAGVLFLAIATGCARDDRRTWPLTVLLVLLVALGGWLIGTGQAADWLT